MVASRSFVKNDSKTMAQETEKKFLVSGEFKNEVFHAFHIVQGYLSSAKEHTVRIRIRDNQGFITIKGKTNETGASRFEWEREIPLDEARQLIEICEPGVIDKTRYLIKNTDGKHIWEVDVFHGDNDGLTIAEIELDDEHETFDKPAWLGEEVTPDPRYFNASLSKNPYKNWKQQV